MFGRNDSLRVELSFMLIDERHILGVGKAPGRAWTVQGDEASCDSMPHTTP